MPTMGDFEVTLQLVGDEEAEVTTGPYPRDIEIDFDYSFARSLKYSMQVSRKMLYKIGLEEYIPLVNKHKVGIDALTYLGHQELQAIGIQNGVHRATIMAACRNSLNVYVDPPTVDEKPVEVTLRLGFARLAGINTVELTCDIKLFIDLYWYDPNMIGVDPDNIPAYVWRPNVYIYNSIDGTGANGGKVNEHPISLVYSETGLMLCPLELEVRISNDMDLRDFPFDSDAIEITIIQSEDGNAEDWVLRQHEDVERSVQFFYDVFETPEWDVNGFSLDFFESTGGNGTLYSRCVASIHIQRRPLFYIWKLVLPLTVTSTFAFGSFFFDVDDLEPRSNTAATTLLTTVAFIYVLTNQLPKTNYQTLIDWFLVFCFIIQLLAWIISNLLVLDSVDAGRANGVDTRAAIVLAVTFFVGTFALFTPKLLKWGLSSRLSPPPYPLRGHEGNELQYYPLEKNKNVWF